MSKETPKSNGKDTMAIRIREDRMTAALASRVNVVPLINTYRDLSDEDKAEFYDDLTIRKKGKLPKVNPWR